MFKINDNYQKLPGSYLFSTIAAEYAFTFFAMNSMIAVSISPERVPITLSLIHISVHPHFLLLLLRPHHIRSMPDLHLPVRRSSQHLHGLPILTRCV